jgi:hypothetical protein
MPKGETPSRPGQRTERNIVLDARLSSLLDFEAFVDGLDFASPAERDRMKLAGGEILDNIVKHGSPLEGDRIYARAARRGGSPVLGFFFRSPSFAAFAGQDWPRAAAEPLFDPAHRRWRGIGLVMCSNLSRSLSFRSGSRMDRIFLTFEPRD